uniref:Interleukin 12 receptor subunit beta 2 n=1 Tax=Falco tinnunculus TaxID=100819 RepID=A0A8C4U719_FALTI
MTANTAPHVQPGTSITLLCQLRPLPYPEQCRIAIFFNGSELIRNYSSSVSTRFPVHTYGKHMFTCKIVCEYKKKLICGIDIESGNPPDEPRNVSCIQYGTDGHPTCTWDKGRLTYINTTYVVHLNKKFGSLALSKLNFDCTYTLVVAASNELGSAFSHALCFFLFLLLVKPHPPNFLVEFENSSVTNCTFFWHGEAQARHCRLRYRPLTRHTWSMVESLNSEKCSLHDLEPHTAYEFQVSCKIHPKRGLWSNWRTYQTWTPEAVPTGILDVWYRQQDMDSQQQNISLFWKALSKAEARGRILQYTVTFEALGQQNLAAEAHHTTQTSYARVTPRVGYKITVTAENSRGRSPPASIMTEPGTQGKGFYLPPPQKVTAVAMGNSSILVSWEPPIRSTASISGYVVEWAAAQRSRRLEPPPAWVKLPAANRSDTPEAYNVCYQISVFALYRGGAGRVASVRGYSRAEAPSAGPQMYATPQANGVLVSWEDIPAHHQRGCITGYRIYLQKKDGQAAPDVYSRYLVKTKRWWHLADLQPGELYTLGMTASTAAGEGPWGNSELVCLESNDTSQVALQVSEFTLNCTYSICRLHSLLSTLMPQWQSKAIPDPANATWAKNYVSTKLGLPCSLPLRSASGFEEPEITQVEEAFTKPGHRDKLLLGSTGGSGSGQETEYQPLPSTADGEVYEQQLPDLYKRIVVEAMEHTETGPEYIANPVANTDAAYLPPVTGTTKDLPELECDPLPVFPTTFLTPIASYEGNVTLATVKISCSSFTR